MPRLDLLAAAAALAILAVGCAPATSDSESSEDAITVDTSTPRARRQYDANVAFATSYVPKCVRSAARSSEGPRVLVTGFGRFMNIGDNATGRIVSALVPEARYPETAPPAPGDVDEPEPQLEVAGTTLDLPDVGEVDVCAMILPVHWDLAAILIAKEAQAFQPTFVLMNGVAGPRQPLWIELGAINRASRSVDGSNQLRPAASPGEPLVKIVETAAEREDAQPNLLSWQAVRASAREAIERHRGEVDGDAPFEDVVQGADLAGFPRPSNTYLCNNVTYVTGWLMSHPRREVSLLRASHPVADAPNDVRVTLDANLSNVPRVFVHWPSDLADKHHLAGADVMKSIIAAQLRATNDGDAPTPGDNSLAAANLGGGNFF